MKFLLRPFLAASLFALASVSNAATYEIFSDNADGIYNETITVKDAVNGVFTDTFTFYIDEDFTTTNVNASDTQFFPILSLIFGTSDFVEFTSASINGNAINTATSGGFIVTSSSATAELELSAGEHILMLTGNAQNDYEYNLNISPISSSVQNITSAVPEPSTYALMLAGLGLVGFMARRRKTA
ncbi:MAG: PEP-CTERM sorting domain-containing protein [Thiotrichales bacterium]|nr:PEP-CTERM sorting domain-containing protein [Thiotrichales bacterium]